MSRLPRKPRRLEGRQRRLSRKTKRKMCRYKQCLFRDNSSQAMGGTAGSGLFYVRDLPLPLKSLSTNHRSGGCPAQVLRILRSLVNAAGVKLTIKESTRQRPLPRARFLRNARLLRGPLMVDKQVSTTDLPPDNLALSTSEISEPSQGQVTITEADVSQNRDTREGVSQNHDTREDSSIDSEEARPVDSFALSAYSTADVTAVSEGAIENAGDDHTIFDKEPIRTVPIASMTKGEQTQKLTFVQLDMRVTSGRLTRSQLADDQTVAQRNSFTEKSLVSSANLSPAVRVKNWKKEEREDDSHENKDERDMIYGVPTPQKGLEAIIMPAMRGNQGQHSMIQHSAMSQEVSRLATFFQFEAPGDIFLIRLAGAGFFLPKSDARDSVECAFCGISVPVSSFRGRNAVDVHREASPTCSFLMSQDVGNISIAQVAERTGAQFVDKYSSRLHPIPLLTAAFRPAAREVLVTDAEPSVAVETPAAVGESLVPASLKAASGTDHGHRQGEPSHPQPAIAVTSQSATVTSQSTAVNNQSAAVTSQPATVSGQTVSDAAHSRASDQPSAPGSAAASHNPIHYQTATVSRPAQLQRDIATPAPNLSAINSGTARVQRPNTAAAAAAATSSSSSASGRNSGGSSRSGNGQERQTVTYDQLGIISQRPKRPDMAVMQVRMNTFDGWTHQQTHPKDQMAEAGFYYTGHEDLVRCFHCKGGLKTWESSDRPWVEHARWFPRCPFLKLCHGQRFIDAVQNLNDPDTRPTISMDAIDEEMKRLEEEEMQNLASDVLTFNNLPHQPPPPPDALLASALRVDADVTEASMQEMAERLEDENEEMRGSTLCKMCQTSEVNVLFLPCGHLVACSQCAPALTTCAMCRQPVKGAVRVHLDTGICDHEQENNGANNTPPAASASSV